VVKLETTEKIILLLLISFLLLSYPISVRNNTSEATTQKGNDNAGSQEIEAPQQFTKSSQKNLTEDIQAEHRILRFSPGSGSTSFTRHIMCKDHDSYYNPVEPTTIFKPSDIKAECLTTVTINNTIKFEWYYRSNSSATDWISCYNWSAQAQSSTEYVYEGHLLIAGYWPGIYFPRAYKVEVCLDGNYSFSEFFEVTNGGLNSPRVCEDIDANGRPANPKSRFTIGVDTKAYHYLRFDKIAYFNEELKYCHNFTTVWIQPDGTTYKTYSASFSDYKNVSVTWDCWNYGYAKYDYISINSSTPVGNWKIEVYLDRYFNNTWTAYGPIATTPFVIGNTPVADWTFMVYLDGDNSLENASIDIFLKMASVDYSPQVHVVVEMDRTSGQDSRYGNWTDCKRFNIIKGMTPIPENAVQNLTEVNMGDPNTLKDFVNWTLYNYPANYYFLVLWDHGTGCMGACFDITNTTDALSLPELSLALSGLPAIMDSILIDACSMSMVEVAYQIKDYANVLIGPEGLGYAPAPYDSYLSALTGNPLMKPNTFATEVVADYIIWCNPIEKIPEATMSAIDLTKMVGLTVAIDDFAIKLEEKETPYHDEITLIRNLTEVYPGPFEGQSGYYVDLYRFAQLISQYVPDQELQDAADQVMAALSIGNTIIIEADKAHVNSHGLAIFFPDKKDKYNDFGSLYEETAFAKDMPWDDFLKYDLSGYVLTIKTPCPGIPINIDDGLYTKSYATDMLGNVRVFVLPKYYIINVTSPFLIEPGHRIVFTKWNDSDTSNPKPLYVTRTLTLEAEYETQYLLIINTNFGTTTPTVGEYWYKADETVRISATTPSTISGEQYVWLGWTRTGNGSQSSMNNPDYITLDGPSNETAVWRHEYYLTVPSLHGSPTPTTGWFEAGKSISVSVASPVSGSDVIRYACSGWFGTGSVPASGTSTSVTFTLNEPSSITWNWRTQYLLVVSTNASGLSPQPELYPPGPWYDNGTSVNCTAQKIGGYTFDYWSVDGTDWNRGVNPITITMDKPYEATAHYVLVAAWWEALFRPEIQIILGLVGTALTAVLIRTAWIRTLGKKPAIVKPHVGSAAIGIAKVVLPGRVTSGCAELDNLLYGGIPENYAVILTSPACDERDLLIEKFLEAGTKEGQITFYVTVEARGASAWVQNFQLTFYLFICNPRADTIVKSLPNVFKLKGVESLTDINIALTKAFRTLDTALSCPRRACIEIVSDVLLQHHAVQTRRWLTDLVPELRSRGFTTLAVMNPKMHPSEEVHALLDLFEGEINIYEKETEKGLEKFVKIKKMHNQKYVDSEMPLRKETL
jgi:KaiC/GvpD/RAD55 family RecA-like ATPase